MYWIVLKYISLELAVHLKKSGEFDVYLVVVLS